MMLLAAGCSFRNTTVALRERLAFDGTLLPQALTQISERFGCEAVILSTCNRVELYLAREAAPVDLDVMLVAEFLGEIHSVPAAELLPHLYHFRESDAVRHLFRVVASLDSLIVGEAQIAGQVKRAYELAQEQGTVGGVLDGLFQHARRVHKRVRAETGIARGQVSISSAAVGYLRDVFEHFGDKTILVIGAGKMGELTLRHLKELRPRRIWVTNRSSDKAKAVADGCGGEAVPWEKLDDALLKADIVLSTTGAPEPIVSLERYNRIRARRSRGRSRGPVVIFDIAVPRDFDPRIHDGDQTWLYNIDDLKRIGEQTKQTRLKHVPAAVAIVEQEQHDFLAKWSRRRSGPVIARLTKDCEEKLRAIVDPLFRRLNGISEDQKKDIEGAFHLYQNQLLHGPISALADEAHGDAEPQRHHTLLDALRKLFRLQD